jgi:uncharacterized damage-inducible protein DinB
MNDTIFAKAMAKELDLEVTSTRKCLERISESIWDYKPHEKSMNLGYLAALVAEIPLWIASMIETDEIDFVTYPHAKLNNTKELVAHFEENVQRATKALHQVKDGELDALFNLKANGQIVYTASKRVNIETTINHMVHHRGQLTVYMRLNDIAVPSIYGPSADDRSF